MIIVMICDRKDMHDRPFRTTASFEHSPVEIDRNVPGWDGTGGGLSPKDLEKIFAMLNDSAENIHSFQVFLSD